MKYISIEFNILSLIISYAFIRQSCDFKRTAPAYRYAHNCGVESLAWLNEGQILAVGCQRRTVQLYDLRVSGTNAPPLSMSAHTEMVSGIVPDCNATMTFATFGRNPGEPVRVWDARMNQSPVSEIALPQSSHRGVGAGVGAVAWSIARPGVLSVAFEDSIRNYDTRCPGSRALPVGVSYLHHDEGGVHEGVDGDDNINSVQCLAYQPQFFRNSSGQVSAEESAVKNPFEFYPHRTMVVTSRGQIQVISESQVAPLAISNRDGRIASALGGTVWIGPTTRGPSAMEGVDQIRVEDISSRMMRRARSFHATKITTDALDNVRILEEERERVLAEEHAQLIVGGLERDAESLQSLSSSSSKNFVKNISSIDQLLRCWRWIALVENQSIDHRNHNESNEAAHPTDDIASLLAKGLVDAGVTKLLRMSNHDVYDEGNNNTSMLDTKATSNTLFCDFFDGPSRR
jgi:WD40 repeat protein